LARRVAGLPERVYAIVWHPQLDALIVAGGLPAQWGTVALVDGAAGCQPRFLCDLPEIVSSIAVSSDGRMLVAGCGDRTVRLFELPGGKMMRTLRQHADWVQAVAISPDGKHLASASRDRTVKIFATATGELESTYTGHETPVIDVAFTPFGSKVVSLGRNRAVHLFDSRTAQREGDPVMMDFEMQRMTIHDSRLITAANDGLVRIHQISDRQLLFALRGHRDVVQAIAISPKDGLIATGSHDGEVCVWETTCGTWLQRFVASPMMP
jgi:WD40 repeat protein